jgi:hypothetical protein
MTTWIPQPNAELEFQIELFILILHPMYFRYNNFNGEQLL